MTKAEPRQKVPKLDYPDAMARKRQEGWVRLSYTVTAEGKVTDIRVLESSDEFGRFEEAAINGLSRWPHKPATINGKPVAQLNAETYMAFVLRPGGKASPESAEAFRQVDSLLQAGKPDEAMAILDGLENGDVGLTIRELALLFARRSLVFQAQGKEGQALVHARKALLAGEDAMGPTLHGVLLLLKLDMELKAGALKAAFETAAQLEKAERKPAGADAALAAVAQARERVAAGKPHLVRVALEQDCVGDCGPDGAMWRHKILRRTVVFQSVEGRVDSVTAQCERKESGGTIKPGDFWSIPASWGECTLQLTGSRGTVVGILEE